MIFWRVFLVLVFFWPLIWPGASAESWAASPVHVGSKKFTESVILGEIAGQLLRMEGIDVVHRRELGGTRVLWNALLNGDIDMYPEYTGTLFYEIFPGIPVGGTAILKTVLAQEGIQMTDPLGFNNTYALGMQSRVADALNIRNISDLANHPDLRFGFTNEFMSRKDGWPGLRDLYRLPQLAVHGVDHDLAYRGLQSGNIQVMDLYTTDPEIRYYQLRIIEDDRNYFPEYRAVLLYREDLLSRFPESVKTLKKLEHRIDEASMVSMNQRAKLEKVTEIVVASEFLEEIFQSNVPVVPEGAVQRFIRNTRAHLTLVMISLSAAILVSIPLGIWAHRKPRIEPLVLGIAGMIQTIPSLALLVFMIPLFGIGGPPAVIALFLYSLLPIIRNTYTGLKEIPPPIRESAEALGLPPSVRLRKIELPLASRTILAGIKTSAVINVGTATLGALIGAGGYGQPILTGIRLDDVSLILQGAVPAALLALLVQGIFEFGERYVVPKGLRLDASV